MITNGQFKPTQLSHFEVLLRSACQIHWNANINDLYLSICVTHPSLLITRVHLKCLFLFISLIHLHVIHFFLFVLHSVESKAIGFPVLLSCDPGLHTPDRFLDPVCRDHNRNSNVISTTRTINHAGGHTDTGII